MLQSTLLKTVIDFLNDYSIGYMLTGSIVSSIQGEPRSTHDIDILIHPDQKDVEKLIKRFTQPDYYLSAESIQEAIKLHSMFNLIDTKDGDKADFWILTASPFDQSRFERRYYERILGMDLCLSRPEDTILAKLLWCRQMNGSQKQMQDAISVYELQYLQLDLKYLNRWIDELALKDYFQQLICNATPLTE